MIKAVVFDLFGVLATEGFTQFRDTYFLDDKAKSQKAIDLVTSHDAGLISKEDYQNQLSELAGVDIDTVKQSMGSNKPNRPLIDYIRSELKPNYKLGVLSNSGDDYINQILEAKDIELFDDVLLSYQTGLVKPQQEIFELSAERLGVLTTEIVFVDDSPSHCEGAKRTGMKTIFYESFPKFKTKLEETLAAIADN